MKIRIQDNSIRLRMTLREVEEFSRTGLVERSTSVLGAAGPTGTFVYRLEHSPGLADSDVVLDGSSIAVRLCTVDRAELLEAEKEGVYIRREWTSPEGRTHRFMAFVEKDRPGSTCIKPERWIYDEPRNGSIETRPIPKKSGADSDGGGRG